MERISGRFGASCGALGFDPPPADLRLKAFTTSKGATLFVQSDPGTPPESIVTWLAPTGPLSMLFGSNRVVRVTYAQLPAAWMYGFADLEVDMVRLRTEGVGTVDVRGSRKALQEFGAMLGTGSAVEVRYVTPTREPGVFLTAPQESALRSAVEAGYYRIPRPVNLHQLAAMSHVTAASLSERLRRAEGQVITRFVKLGCPRLDLIPDGVGATVSIPDLGPSWRPGDWREAPWGDSAERA